MKGGLHAIGNEAEITALVKRLERRGLVGLRPPLSPEEVQREFNRIRNEGRTPKGRKPKATKGAKG